MKFKNKRLTKAVIEKAKQRRAIMFEGMTESEIRQHVPINKGYLHEYENERAINWGLFIPECVVCGGTHIHGNGGSGTYSKHCNNDRSIIGEDEVFPSQYEIVLDMSDEDNQRLSEKYGVK
ncbi:hypothetical protein [Bacillus ndiopicus]|uniref:hypothetical protein n=1 Tax=Bacillus ndiopicus TaxID=1347368 RepID=UPI0005A974D1|nr:hypothetical protein [Bacillus ndiopicus]